MSNYSNRRRTAKAAAKSFRGSVRNVKKSMYGSRPGHKRSKKAGPGRECKSPFDTRCENG